MQEPAKAARKSKFSTWAVVEMPNTDETQLIWWSAFEDDTGLQR
jgi:hypothetical protein